LKEENSKEEVLLLNSNLSTADIVPQMRSNVKRFLQFFVPQKETW
jgi:hypothetical protein